MYFLFQVFLNLTYILYQKLYIKSKQTVYLAFSELFQKKTEKAAVRLTISLAGLHNRVAGCRLFYFQSLNKSFIAASIAAFILCSIILKIIASS